MLVTCVHVYVKKEHVDDFIAATIKNHEASVKEPGNMRFDVLQSKADPTRFLLYEAYETEETAKAHKETPHYLEWKDAVEDWIETPRAGVPYGVIRPTDREAW
jgi:autoinducer 2-degrading protein